MSQPEVTMIVVSWNVRDALRRCITAALQSQGCRPSVIVIDNASVDGSADMVAREFSNVRLIRNTENRGFSAAVNQGLAARSGHVLLLNSDTELQSNTVQILLEWMNRDSRAGILGPQLRYTDGQIQPSAKRFPRWLDLALQLSKLPNIFPWLGYRYHLHGLDWSKTQEVDQVMGSCFFIRPEVLDQVGTFDEGFWIWYEEVDFSLRARQRGWTTLYVAEAQAVHGRGQSFQQISTVQKQRYLRHSIRYYVRKHFGVMASFWLWPFLWMSSISAWVIETARWKKPSLAKNF